MRHISLSSLILLCCLSLALLGCDQIPEEATIVYDVDFPRADSDEAQGGSGSGSGSGGSGGAGSGSSGSGSGSGGYDPDNSSIGYTITESGGSTDVNEGATDTFDIVLNSAPTDNITITVTTPNTGDVLVSSTGGSLSTDNTTLTLTFTPSNWNTPQSVTVTGVEDATDEGGGTTAVNLTVSLTQSLDTDWVPADIPDSTITANLTDSQATGPPSQITDLAVTDNGTQTITLGWTAASGAANQILYWSTTSPVTTSSDNFTLSGTATSYVHGGLTASTAYYYMIVPINGLGSASPSNEVSGTPSSFTGCNTSGTLTDTDPDLLVHYPFSNSLADVKNLGTTGSPYTLTNVTSWGGNSVSGSIKYAQGCAYGQAAYFDSTTGYLVNEDFDNASISALNDNYTVSMWLYPETSSDPSKSRHAILSGYDSSGPDFQLEYRESTSVFEWNAVQKLQVSPYPANQWYHVALVKHDNGTGSLYVNGALASSANNHSTAWDLIGMGISRSRGTAGHWKGYIDEVKVYGRAFTVDNVTETCLLYEECEKYLAPKTPTGLTATDPNNGTSINLSWNATTGADNYTVYWTSNPATPIDPSNPATYDNSTTVTGTSTTATGLTNGTSYDFTIIATNTAGNSSPATEVNATPTLVLPAAVDNATAYHGFYSAYGIESGKTYNFNPSYYITWNHHPDRASGDKYYIYISDNASVPIDPNDNTTYIATRESSYNSNNTQILTAFSVYPENDPNFLVGIPPRFGVVFYDASKGVYSPISNQVTPPLASEALREIGDLRIQSGYFSAGDNSTLTSFTIGTDIKIVHKDPINVGERFIIDGAFLSSDVIPQIPQSGNDYLRLTFFNPNLLTPYPNYGRVYDIGGYFQYTKQVPYLQTNTIRSNSPPVCGTNSAADCDFGMEIQGEDSVGMIIHNGTLNGATDYAADESSAPAYGNGEKQVGSVNVDNSSYAGMYVYTNNGVRVDINLTNADAAMSKVAIPFRPPDNLSVSVSGSNINLSWDNSTSFTNTYDIYRSTDNSTWSLVTSLNGYDNTTHTDASLADGTYYYKIGANGTYYTPDNSTVASGVIATTPNVTLGIDNATVTEGDSGSQTRTLTAALDRVATSTVTVNLSLNTSGTCTANVSDYSVSSPITINSGQSQATSNVTVYGDTTVEDNETACIDVSSVTNASENGTQQVLLTILNDDAPPAAIPDPTSLTAAGGEQQVKLTWTKVVGANYYRFHWKLDNVTTNLLINTASSSTYDGYFDVQGQNTTLFIHGGLAAGDYHYVMTAHTNAGYATAQFPDSSTGAKEGTATAFTTVTRVTDNDTSLRVYYDFDNSSGNGLANKSTQPANAAAYDLSLSGNATIIFGGSHFSSDQAAYFDANGGYAHNDNFSDSNESLDNFTVSIWVRPDEDMNTYASILATADSNGAGKFQISDNGSLGIVAMTDNKRQWLEAGTVPIDNWTHVVAVKRGSQTDNGTLTFYLNGVVGSNNMLYCPDNTKDTCADNSSLTDFDTAWDKIKLGINRQSQNAWKGYIDEFKVYNRSLSAQEVCNLYQNHGPRNASAICGITSTIVAGNDHFCFLNSSTGALKCWGDTSSGQVGTGVTGVGNSVNAPATVTTTGTVSQLSAADSLSCVVNTAGNLYCWGGIYQGDGSNYGSVGTPTQITAVSNVVDVELGANDEIYVYASDNSIDGWGGNQQGALGVGTSNSAEKTKLDLPWTPRTRGISPQKVFEAGSGSTNCFVSANSDNNRLYCMGEGNPGKFANGGDTDNSTPQLISALGTGVWDVAVGHNNVCAIDNSRDLYCWGKDDHGQLGNGGGSSTEKTVPASPILQDLIDVKIGNSHVCAIKSGGAVYCWGDNQHGQVGDGSSGNDVTTPDATNGITNGVQLALSAYTTCVLKFDDTVSCWGKNDDGQVGNGGVVTPQPNPVNLGTP